MKRKEIYLILATYLAMFLISGCDSSKKEGSHIPEKSINREITLTHKPLAQLQQEFLDLRFGMFIHFNIPTFANEDWPNPMLSVDVFNPVKLDCNQWADAAVSAGMTYGCLTTKHHSGFCIWPTKTTDNNVMNSPVKRDIVKEYVDAFRKRGLKVFLYYSILDTHHNIRPGWTKKEHTQFIKDQLTELFTNYGEIACLVIDGWDANWSRMSYEEIPFEEIYLHVKAIQPNCLISEHNAAKYPDGGMFYTDIKHYEQNAGQFISKENKMPAQAGIPINKTWFWKDYIPQEKLKDVDFIINDNLMPLNESHCNFILNVAPNRDGLIDENAILALEEIGKRWQHPGPTQRIEPVENPIVSSNLAKFEKVNSSWSRDSRIMDLANDDNFKSNWRSHKSIQQPFFEVVFDKSIDFNMICIVEPIGKASWYSNSTRIKSYELQYWSEGEWKNIEITYSPKDVKIHRFDTKKSNRIRLQVKKCDPEMAITEIMVYNEAEASRALWQ